jgi:hypothetical protein
MSNARLGDCDRCREPFKGESYQLAYMDLCKKCYKILTKIIDKNSKKKSEV